MKGEAENPWLQIPLEDYEGHMSASNVQQLQMLDELFEEILNEFSPKSLCVLGSTAGNGFQHLIQRTIDRVVGIDINFKYTSECRAWFIQDISNLQLICADLNEIELADSVFDLIHAALIFEYVDVEKLLTKIYRWLKPSGILSVVLQLPCENSGAVSETQFQSVKVLEPFIKLVEPDEFKRKAEEQQLFCEDEIEIELSTGKPFLKASFRK
ncbi:MAG: class I SAM-dependent methyltransferase [Ignavibacteriales bacterium]|nr:class I SAM-dependent methyltransferase [Ignavibacteriales bacterium]